MQSCWQYPIRTSPSMFHIDAKRTISSHWEVTFTIIKYPALSISLDKAFMAEEIKPSSKTCPSYFSWSFTTIPIILESFCASKIPAILGIYALFSKSSCTRFTVSSETFFVFPCITFDTVAVLSPSSCAISLILILSFSTMPSPSFPSAPHNCWD